MRPGLRSRALAGVLVALASSCAGGGSAGEKAPPAGAVASPNAPAVTCPLTGQRRPAGFPISRPTVAIKVENSIASRPQAGLEKADIVYEELTEGGITRFMALFHCSDASRVGPVRSARWVDPDILLEYTPVLFAYAGANPVVLDKVVTTRGIVDLRDGIRPDAYRRDRDRKRPHNLFTSTEELRALSKVRGAPMVGLTFRPPPSPQPSSAPAAPAAPAGPILGTGTPAPLAHAWRPGTSASFSFGAQTVRYVYDATTSTYLRFHGQTPHRAEGGRQLAAVNVVILGVRVRPGTIRDAAGNLSPEVTVVGEGEATVLSQGLAVTGRWRRPTLSDRTGIRDSSGAPILLPAGNTWIHLIPEHRPIGIR